MVHLEEYLKDLESRCRIQKIKEVHYEENCKMDKVLREGFLLIMNKHKTN